MNTTQILPNPPTAMLKAVHGQIRELFGRYSGLRFQETPAKKALSHEIRELLRVHLEIEEVLFYPALQNTESDLGIKVVLKALHDHQQVKVILRELKTLSLEHKPLDPKMAELQECVFAHLQLEEEEIFLHARALSPEILVELGAEMETLRERLRENR